MVTVRTIRSIENPDFGLASFLARREHQHDLVATHSRPPVSEEPGGGSEVAVIDLAAGGQVHQHEVVA